jgi:hypothetical protein
LEFMELPLDLQINVADLEVFYRIL